LQIVLTAINHWRHTLKWNVVKTRGIEDVKAVILKFTFFSKEKNCQFAGDVGAK
jgi:hypothetical protein